VVTPEAATLFVDDRKLSPAVKEVSQSATRSIDSIGRSIIIATIKHTFSRPFDQSVPSVDQSPN
jgi:hypothetical protein